MTQPNLLNLAKQGDTKALTNLLNRSLQARGISAKATRRNENLHILLEGQETPNKTASVRCIQQGLEKLGLVDMPVTIYGREQGQTQIAWQEHLTAPITSVEEDSFFDAELLEDGDASGSLLEASPMDAELPEPSLGIPTGDDLTGGEPTQVSEDWSDQATAIETMEPLPPQAPPPPGMPPASGSSWDNFDLDAAPAEPTGTGQTTTGFEPPPDESWGAGMPVDYSPEDPEPTLIVPDEGEDDMDGALSDEEADSEILLSLWDDANLDDDIEPSGDISVDNLELWQEGEAVDTDDADGTVLSDEPMLVGDPSASSAKSRKKSSSCLPLLLLGLLALLGGIATAAHLKFLDVPLLAKIPGVGPLLAPDAEERDGEAGAPTNEGEESGTAPAQAEGDAPAADGADAQAAADAQVAADAPAEAPKAVESTTTDDPAPVTAPESTPPESAAVPDDPFRDAVNAATQAATLAQTAATPEEWSRVAEYWGSAVDNMKAVPTDHPKYDVAQDKVPEYQRYLDYAQQLQ